MTIKEYQYVDSYEKALAFFVLKLEKTNNHFLKSLDINSINDYEYYLKYFCNIGVKIDEFNLSLGFSIPFDYDYYINQNGNFYDSILTKNENLDLVDIPNPSFESIFTYIPLSKPPSKVNNVEKYIVWLAYQMEKAESDINIVNKTNPPYEFKNFLINTRNLEVFEEKSNYTSNSNYPSYDKNIDLGYINFSHIFSLNKDYLFRYGNFINAITPKLQKNPNIKEQTKNNFEIETEISKKDYKFRIIKSPIIKLIYGFEYDIKVSRKLRLIKDFADYGIKRYFSSTQGKINTTWINEQKYESTGNFVKYTFSGLFYKTKYQSTGGKLDSRPVYNSSYDISSSITKIIDVKYNVEFKTKKNYIYKNLIASNR